MYCLGRGREQFGWTVRSAAGQVRAAGALPFSRELDRQPLFRLGLVSVTEWFLSCNKHGSMASIAVNYTIVQDRAQPRSPSTR